MSTRQRAERSSAAKYLKHLSPLPPSVSLHVQTVVCGVLMLGTMLPYVQYLMFSQALTTQLQDEMAKLQHEREDDKRHMKHLEVGDRPPAHRCWGRKVSRGVGGWPCH